MSWNAVGFVAVALLLYGIKGTLDKMSATASDLREQLDEIDKRIQNIASDARSIAHNTAPEPDPEQRLGLNELIQKAREADH